MTLLFGLIPGLAAIKTCSTKTMPYQNHALPKPIGQKLGGRFIGQFQVVSNRIEEEHIQDQEGGSTKTQQHELPLWMCMKP